MLARAKPVWQKVMNELSWDTIQQSYDELTTQLSDPSLESETRHKLQKKHAYLASVLTKKSECDDLDHKRAEAHEAAAVSEDEEFIQLCKEEELEFQQKHAQCEKELTDLLFPSQLFQKKN